MKKLESQAELLRLEEKSNRRPLVGLEQGSVKIKVMEHGEVGGDGHGREKSDMRHLKTPFCLLILNVTCALQQVRKYTKSKEENNYQKSFTLRYSLLMFCHIFFWVPPLSLPLIDIGGEFWNKDDINLIYHSSGKPSWISMQDSFSVLIIFCTYVAGAQNNFKPNESNVFNVSCSRSAAEFFFKGGLLFYL